MSRRKPIEETDPVVVAEVEATGVITVRRDLASRRAIFRWDGGNVAKCVTSALTISMRGFVRREGDVMWVGPFRTRVVREDEEYTYLERMSE